MPGRMVSYQSNGGTSQGYLATPASGSGPGIVVIQEWWGLVDHIKDVAERFAAEGFVALAPDLYHGQEAKEPDEAGKLMMALNIDQAAKDLRGAVSYLLGEGGASGDKVGAIGYCMGGQLALYAGMVSPDQVGAIADYYGIHPSVQFDAAKLKAPVLGIFAEHDSYASPEVARSLEQQIRAQGIEADFHVYPGTHHAFFNDTADIYNAEAAADAWQKTLAFFHRHLG